MASTEQGGTLFRIVVDGSTYFATGRNAFAAYAKLVEHDCLADSFSHKESLDFSVEVAAVGEASQDVAAWQMEA